MKKYTSTELPLTTSNAALAFALYLSGVPFADNEAPLSNIYDAEILRKLGYEKTKIEDAVKLAFSAGQKGHVEYGFKRDGDWSQAVDAFKAQERALKASQTPARDIVAEISQSHAGGLYTLTEAIASATCVVLKRWRDELKLWEQHRLYTSRRNQNEVKNYDAQEIARAVFLAGEPYAFLATAMDARKVFSQLHRNYPPVIRLRRGSGVHQEGDRYRMPGFAVFSQNADNEIRRHLGVPLK